MKTIMILLAAACIGISTNTSAQWSPNGTHIYSSNTGNVGIGTGTANPSTKLQVVGEGTFGNNGYGMLGVGYDDGTYLWIRNATNDRTLRFNAGNAYFDLKTGGNFEWTANGNKRMLLGSQTLGSTATNSVILKQIFTSGGSGGNLFTNSSWLYRDANGTNWLTARLHDAISVDGSYLTPGVDTRTWWERDPYDNIQSWGTGSETYLTLKQGNVGIGTTNPGSFRLAVEGKIGASEVVVTLTRPWPDFVFEKQHNLISLSALEQFILQNKHLPDVPTETEINDHGLKLGEMDALLLQKIEELTLYLIEQNKKIDKLQAELEQSRNR